MLLPKKASFVLRQMANLRLGSRAKISSCFQLRSPVEVGMGSRASKQYFFNGRHDLVVRCHLASVQITKFFLRAISAAFTADGSS